MKWSRYNYLFKSSKYGNFLYNARTNSFFKPNDSLYNIFQSLANGIDNIDNLNHDIKDKLIKVKVLVNELEDDNYIIQQQYLKYSDAFSDKALGLVIAPTTSCNFMCPYCYELGMLGKNMSKKTENDILRFIKDFGDGKDIFLAWHGGEPLLKFNTIQRLLYSISSDKNIRLKRHSLVTNGYLLDKEKCDFFKNYSLNSVQITIDGLAKTHDKSRLHKTGKPTFDIICKNIDYLLASFPECFLALRVNIHEENKDDFPFLYEKLTKKWKGKNCRIYLRHVTDHGNCNVACIQHKSKAQFLVNLYKKHKIKDIYFYPKYQLGGCTATHSHSFVIGPGGELYKCWVDMGKKDRIIGHVNDDKINVKLVSEYVVGTSKFNDPKCKSCFLFPVCDGGCGLFRLEYKLKKTPYNVCPFNPEDIDIILEAFYEQKLSKEKNGM